MLRRIWNFIKSQTGRPTAQVRKYVGNVCDVQTRTNFVKDPSRRRRDLLCKGFFPNAVSKSKRSRPPPDWVRMKLGAGNLRVRSYEYIWREGISANMCALCKLIFRPRRLRRRRLLRLLPKFVAESARSPHIYFRSADFLISFFALHIL